LHQDYELADVRRLLQNSPGIIVEDEPDKQIYPMAINSEGRNEVFVGRLRRDLFNPRGLNMWVVSDNLLKGAAWNAVQIAEHLIK
jgi:aspartate-semialdehyde dehydrogenase